MKEPCGFFHKIPSGKILIRFMKELCGFFQKLPDGHIDGLFVISFSINPAISLRSKWWAFFEKTPNLPTG